MRKVVIPAFILFLGLNAVALFQAHSLVTNPLEDRRPLLKDPADFGLDFETVQVNTKDNLLLNGWYIKPDNASLIIMQHGYKRDRSELLQEAAMLAEAGYGVLITSVRAHDVNPGEEISFGLKEMNDLDAWVQYARTIPNIDQDKIGMLGNSLGASMAIQYSANHEVIRAVVAHSAFSSMQNTIETSVRHFTGLPPFPFAPLIQFWAELILGISIDDIDATQWISNISPRPVFLIHSLDDDVISPQSGNLLFDAALDPRQIWLESGIGHANFDTEQPDEFEKQVVGFFNSHFFGDPSGLATNQANTSAESAQP